MQIQTNYSRVKETIKAIKRSFEVTRSAYPGTLMQRSRTTALTYDIIITQI